MKDRSAGTEGAFSIKRSEEPGVERLDLRGRDREREDIAIEPRSG
jgi:hypothetical protein